MQSREDINREFCDAYEHGFVRYLQDEFSLVSKGPVNLEGQIVEPLKKITIIGGKADHSGNDIDAIEDLFARLSLAGIPLHHEPEFDIVNIDPKFGGRDFLKETDGEADLIISGFIFNPPKEELKNYISPSPVFSQLMVSRDHFEPSIWHDRAVALKAKMIAVVAAGEESEVGTNFFEGSNFVKACAVHQGSLGLLLEKDYLNKIKTLPALNEQNPLGKNIIEATLKL